MRFKSLKARISVDLAFLLLSAICLTDLLFVRIMEGQLLERQYAVAQQWILSQAHIEGLPARAASAAMDCLHLPESEGESGEIVGAVFQFKGSERTCGTFPDPLNVSITELNRQAIQTGHPAHQFYGESWGVFWKASKYVIISIPFPDGGAGAAILLLEPTYRLLRGSQRIALIYLVINFCLLFFIGTYRLTRVTTRPINRLIKLTDAYRSSDRFDLHPEKQSDEFGRLSTALNRLVKRVEQDQETLRQSLEIIEIANRELKQAQMETVRAEKLASIGRLSAGIAHEIGNPIGIVLGYLGLLRTRSISPDDTAAIDYIDRAESEIYRINGIIRHLLEFARPSRENAVDMSVHDLIHDIGNMLSPQPLMEQIRIRYDLGALQDRVHADYDQLRQVLVNLMINAADSISGSGEIVLMTRNSGIEHDLIQLSVQDNGSGIPEEYIDKIFDPFYTTKAPGKGTGLGLSVSYRIIERIGGTLEAISDSKNAGTRMVISIPLVTAPSIGVGTGTSNIRSYVTS